MSIAAQDHRRLVLGHSQDVAQDADLIFLADHLVPRNIIVDIPVELVTDVNAVIPPPVWRPLFLYDFLDVRVFDMLLLL